MSDCIHNWRVTYDVDGYYFNVKCLNCPHNSIQWIPECVGLFGEIKTVEKINHKAGRKKQTPRFSRDIAWHGDRENLMEEMWVREGNVIKTLVIQRETGLPHARQARIATVDDACDETGRTLRSKAKIEIANLIAASPDLLRASIRALQLMSGHANRTASEAAHESREVSKDLMDAINRAKGAAKRSVW